MTEPVNQIVPPVLPDVVRFIGQFAIAKNAITRNVSAHIRGLDPSLADGGCRNRRHPAADGFRFVKAKAMEVSGELGGQIGNIALT